MTESRAHVEHNGALIKALVQFQLAHIAHEAGRHVPAEAAQAARENVVSAMRIVLRDASSDDAGIRESARMLVTHAMMAMERSVSHGKN